MTGEVFHGGGMLLVQGMRRVEQRTIHTICPGDAHSLLSK